MATTTINLEEKSYNLIANKEIQKNLQAKYFCSKENCDTLLTAFHRCLASKDRNTTIHRSSSGGTGFTFLCSMPSTAVENNNEEAQPIRLVLKWQNEGQCSIEKMGSLLFQFFGFPAPEILSPDVKLARKISGFAVKECQAFESAAETMSMIAMPQLHANNFKEALKNGKFQRLSIEDQAKVADRLGEITVVDIFFGNNDRLLKFTSDSKNPFHYPSCFNSGNVMLEIEEFDEKIRLVEIYPIDNCTASDLMDKKRQLEEPEYFDGRLFLFGENKEKSLLKSPKREIENDLKDVSQLQNDCLSPLRETSQASNDIEQKLIGYHQVFRRLINDGPLLTTHVLNNVKKEILEHSGNIDHCKQFIMMFPHHFNLGKDRSIEKIRKMNFSSLVDYLTKKQPLDSFNQRGVNLMEMNYSSLKEQSN